jgi:transposase-like protein
MSDAFLAVGEDGVQPRRRRYSREFKRQVVEQSLQPGVSAAQRSGSVKLNRLDKCIIGVFSLGKGAGAGDLYEQTVRAAQPPRV